MKARKWPIDSVERQIRLKIGKNGQKVISKCPQLFGLSHKPASDSFRCYILVRIPIGPNVWLIFFKSGPSQLSDKTSL